jgi:hypothetical protein
VRRERSAVKQPADGTLCHAVDGMRPTEPTIGEGDDGRAFVARAPWRFAKTMPDIPHEYTVRGQTLDDEFDQFVLLIRRDGYKRRFGKTTYIYLNIDGHRYWTMGAPVDATTVINRALLAER